MYRKLFLTIAGIVFSGYLFSQPVPQTEEFVRYVNPFIGTQEMGHTFPGACVPFGMVQLSPDTDTIPYEKDGKYNPDVYRYCAGYQYNDKTIVGFSHTHLSGTGHSDLGDFLLMPTTGKLKLNPGEASKPGSGYRSHFSHENEKAEPGYYRVKLNDYDINAELTATTHVGFHKYTFPKTDNAHLILDLVHGIYNYDGKVIWSSVRVENDTLITGYRITRGWARTNYLYFAMVVSKPIKNYGCKNDEKLVYKGFWRKFNQEDNFPEMAGKKLRVFFDFSTNEGEAIMVKFALSAVSTEGALKNLQAEVPHWDFGKTRDEAKAAWHNELSKIIIKAPADRMENFYTSMYHAFISPVQYMDVDGQYRGLDANIHHADGFTNFTVFSLWDTYRALHPLFTIVQPRRDADMINSMLAHYDQSVHKLLPVWSHSGNENWCMIGYHSVSVIADAYQKGIRGFDANKALEACLASANNTKYFGVGEYIKYGYVPLDVNAVGASLTLEYAYDDWTIAQFAGALGKTDIQKQFMQRSGNWKNLFDKSTGFIRARKSDGSWKTPFDAMHTDGEGFIEGNAWNYSLYVPQDIPALIGFMGGNRRFAAHLDSLFTMDMPDKYFAETEDITRDGLLGSYVHGNEPSHHVAYMYNYAGMPWKTQYQIHRIVNTMYKNKPNGLCGNDDCGQMSAWYIFSTLGFYPVCPGSNRYDIGSPCVDEASIRLENGKKFIIKVKS
ncbi:MAG TPA: GH92 family glycosyl hydrolase, partial [Bacteroidales bacterium]|nr:GH92 family glycosyl hydrolase [Bacteroidales bacterium]